MNIYTYLDTTPENLQMYINEGLVDRAEHDDFPLSMLTYGRKATYDNVWDNITRRCRGLIFNRDTFEIVARPFEKFFNLGTAGMPETDPSTWGSTQTDEVLFGKPTVWEKMDGFLATLYSYNGKSYIASKGSFHSPHAKWASAQIKETWQWPLGYTPVFEGICPDLRIVVDYKDFQGLILLALINNETGEELDPCDLHIYANKNGVEDPRQFPLTVDEARKKAFDVTVENFEGYVLTWYRAGTTPFRLKVKYIDYLRLHRMVSGVSAKAIFKCLAHYPESYTGDLQDWLDNSTPWFADFVKKWKRALETRYEEIHVRVSKTYLELCQIAKEDVRIYDRIWTRKEWAERFTASGNKDISGVLFGMLDGKDIEPIIWKLVRPMIKNSKPMIDVTKM